jgi:hypothetical protein
MSQVLKYGVPQSDGLRCDNPACSELANVSLTFEGIPDPVFACTEHVPGMQLRGKVKRFQKLTVPGSRNKELPDNGKESKEGEEGG